MIFDREDGCWLPAGLDSDTFPIFADRPFVGGAVPFGSHVSRRPGRAGSAGRGELRQQGVGSVPESRGFFCPWGWGASRAWIRRSRAGGARFSPRECVRIPRFGGAGAVAEPSRGTSADDSRLLSPSLKGFFRLKEFTCTGGKSFQPGSRSRQTQFNKKLCCGWVFYK